jgi:hypothetical protein
MDEKQTLLKEYGLNLTNKHELKAYLKTNKKILAYGNGSVYENVKYLLKQENVFFYDVLHTNDSNIKSLSDKNYKDTINEYSILICSSFYDEIIETIQLEELNLKSIKIAFFDNNLLHLRLRNETILKGLKKKDKIRVLFLAIHKSVWKVDSVFTKMLEDSYFEPIVLICPYTSYGEERMYEDLKESYQYFKEKGYPVISSYDENNDSWIQLNELKPDIVFFTNPHKITKKEYYLDAYTNYLCCYAGYGMHTAKYDNYQSQYNQHFHNIVWKIFVQNKDMLNGYRVHSNRLDLNTHLVIDNIVEEIRNKQSNQKEKWKNNLTHKKIIWAPHHTILEDETLKLGTFLEYSEFFLQLAKATIDSITWSFKPHPILKSKLYMHHAWGKNKTNAYYEFWEKSQNTQYDDGEYIDLFKESDALILDSASFLAEYIFTEKPMLYLMKNDTINYLNSFGKECLSTISLSYNENTILLFIKKVIENKNPNILKQKKFIKNYYNNLPGNKTSSEIINIIKKSINGSD